MYMYGTLSSLCYFFSDKITSGSDPATRVKGDINKEGRQSTREYEFLKFVYTNIGFINIKIGLPT